MKRYLLSALLLTLACSAIADEVPFNQAKFDQAKAAGQPVVVYFHADWCPTCRVQQPIVARLAAEPQLKAVTIFEADFDTETALEKTLKVGQQSTFVVFKHGQEVSRSTGQTQEPVIRATLQKAL
ncbi:thioredoxin family protein [Rhodanobacter sp. MP7CTX1]|uniref:thioredoxin family protein n=1 Tax=Rhodanobacter sp. MP7CTX1 TaxID=2723084 RepID=UPI001619CA20|nr:thioredoxin family protein [Rhodanobacter sp. MP7CTX1]MBB6188711.1 thiol-disulfide isomerase/thioredoxin [Rhodanobacter sp. MP7CTX1]